MKNAEDKLKKIAKILDETYKVEGTYISTDAYHNLGAVIEEVTRQLNYEPDMKYVDYVTLRTLQRVQEQIQKVFEVLNEAPDGL